jgi:Sulfotransferase domain
MRLPDFLVIGAARAGTTSLHNYLHQHPELFLSSRKELNYFSADYPWPLRRGNPPVRTLAEYAGHFQDAAPHQRAGEVSPRYLMSEAAPARIRDALPHAKLIATLRDPVTRAASHHAMDQRDGLETRSFEDVIRADLEGFARSGRCSVLLRAGLYADQLGRYFARFDRSQIQIHLFEDLETDSGALLRRVFGFLEVDDRFVPPDAGVRYNAAGVPTRRLADALLRKRSITSAVRRRLPLALRRPAQRWIERLRSRGLESHAISPETLAELSAFYREGTLRLQDLIGRDLSRWLRSPA